MASDGSLIQGESTRIAKVARLLVAGITAAWAGSAIADPAIDATKEDTLEIDVGDTGEANPGDTLRYTVTITNIGDEDATAVRFEDFLDPNTTLVPDSLKVTPIAIDDLYTISANVDIGPGLITIDADSGVLANDRDPDAAPCVGCTVALLDDSALVGLVDLAANGSFTYEPFPGNTDDEVFTYTLTDADGLTDTASVRITFPERIWFVDNSVPTADSLGTLADPFHSLAEAEDASLDGDMIYVLGGDGLNVDGLDEGITLKPNQKLLGQGVDLNVLFQGDVVTVAPAGTRPVITHNAGTAVTLGQNNTVMGLNIGDGTNPVNGTGLFGSNAGTLTLSQVAANSSGGPVVDLDQLDFGTSTVTFNTLTSTNSGGPGLVVTNSTGSFAVSGATTITDPTDPGVRLEGNAGASFGFAGLNITNSGNTGLLAVDSGTLAITSSSNSIATTDGTAVSIQGTTIGTDGIAFESVSASGGSNGIVLSNTGSTGSFTVIGDGDKERNQSGGQITGTSGAGVALTNAHNVTLQSLDVTNAGAQGINSSGGSNVVLSGVTVQNPENQAWNAENLAGDNRIDSDSLFTQVNTASTAALRFHNTGTNGNLTIDGSTFSNQGAGNGNTYVTVDAFGSSSIGFTVTNSLFTGLRGGAFTSSAQPGSTGTMTTLVENSSFTNAAADGSGRIAMVVGSPTATHNFQVLDSTFTGLSTTGLAPEGIITANVFGDGGTLSGTISGNTIDNNNGTRRGIQIVGQPLLDDPGIVGSVNVTIDDNDIDRNLGNFAILTDLADRIGPSTINITNNRIGQLAGSVGQVGEARDGAMLMRVQGTPAATASMTISDNTIAATTNDDSGARVPGTAGPPVSTSSTTRSAISARSTRPNSLP